MFSSPPSDDNNDREDYNDDDDEEEEDDDEKAIYFEGVVRVHARLSPEQMAPTHVLRGKKDLKILRKKYSHGKEDWKRTKRVLYFNLFL